MPWTIADVDRFNSGLTDSQKRRWVRIANSVLESCLSDGGSHETCDAMAIRQANSAVSNNSMGNLKKYSATTVRNYEPREEIHEGKLHLVVPVVMMREGVHSGSHGAIYHRSEELGRFIDSWNGMPIVIFHPEIDGMPVSANHREVLEREKVGRVFASFMEGDKLRGEAWIDIEKLERTSPNTLERIRNGASMDVSVGVFTDEVEEQGTWNNEQYHSIAYNYRPDHLALLPDAQGACSWEDGCGIRVNQSETKKKGGIDVTKTITLHPINYQGTEKNELGELSLSNFGHENWEDLDQEQRNKVASHFLVQSGEGFESLMYPVVNPENGKLSVNSLKKYASEIQTNLQPGEFDSLVLNKAKELLGPSNNSCCSDPTYAFKNLHRQGVKAEFISNEAGYHTIAEKIQRKLDRMDREGMIHWLEELYEEYFIYRVSEDSVGKYYRRAYNLDQAGNVTFGAQVIEIRKEVNYIPIDSGIENNQNNSQMKNKKVDALIANSATRFTEEDRGTLEAMDESVLDKMSPVEANQKTEVSGDNLAEALKSYAANDTDKFISLFPQEVQGQMKHGLKLHADFRKKMIEKIQSNTAEGVWTEESLNAMDTDMLERVSKSIPEQTDYSLNGQVEIQDNSKEAPLLPGGVERK
jgi:hypothetical protein